MTGSWQVFTSSGEGPVQGCLQGPWVHHGRRDRWVPARRGCAEAWEALRKYLLATHAQNVISTLEVFAVDVEN